MNDWGGKREEEVGLESETLEEEEELWRIGIEKGGEEEIVVVDMVIAIGYNNTKSKTHTDGDWLMNNSNSSTHQNGTKFHRHNAKDDVLSIP